LTLLVDAVPLVTLADPTEPQREGVRRRSRPSRARLLPRPMSLRLRAGRSDAEGPALEAASGVS